MRAKNSKCSIHETPNGTFRIRFCDETGNKRSVNVRTKTECENIQRAIKRGDVLDRWFPSVEEGSGHRVSTFADLATEFLKHRADVKEISESCLGNYEGQLRLHILPVLGARRLDVMSIVDIENLAQALKAKMPQTRSYKAVRTNELYSEDDCLSAAYRREILILACTIAKFGFERGYLARHPFQNFELPNAGDKPFDYWRPEEEDRFLDWLEQGGPYELEHTNRRGERYVRSWKVWNHAKILEVVLIALRTGMRRGEIAALTMDCIDFDNGLIMVRSSWCEKEGRFKNVTKNGSYRRVEMNDDVRDILLSYRHLPGNKPIFRAIMRSHTVKKFSELTLKAGVRPLHFHGLRHTFLTNMANGTRLAAPIPLPKVMELAGHSSIETTMIYVHSAGIAGTSSGQMSRADIKRQKLHLVASDAKEA